MGCCISYEKVKKIHIKRETIHVLTYSQSSTIEVILDENGVAHRVAEGKGTHIIRTYPDKETKIERKPPTKPSEISSLSRPDAIYYPKKSLMTVSCFPSRKVRPGEPIDASTIQNEKP
jgi:hypothetical protein